MFGAVAPLFLAFAALAAVPVAIHLFGRPRAERRRFAAIEFLRLGAQRTAPERRLRHLLLLLARAAAIVAVPLALARPYVEATASAPSRIGEGGPESAVIVLDDSRSMGFVHHGRTLFEAARERARALIGGLGEDSEATLLLVSNPAAATGELTADRTRLRRALADASLSLRPGDTTAALRRAAAILASAPQAERRIYLLSDLAAHGLAGDLALPGAPPVAAIDVAAGVGRDNRAVEKLTVEAAPELGPRGLRVDVTIANFGDEPVKELPITLRVDGHAVAKGRVEIPPRGRAVKRFFHILGDHAAVGEPARGAPASDGAGVTADAPVESTADAAHDLRVELAADDLADDDRRFARVELQRRLHVLVVDGDPRTIRRDDEVFFLETALRPGDRDDSRIDVTVSAVEELGRRRLDDFDAVFIANAKAFEPRLAAALAAFVQAGGGLLLAPGDNVDPEAWNGALGDLLPQPLATVRTVAATAGARDDGESRTSGLGEHIAGFDLRHPLLVPFAAVGATSGRGGAAEALREARVSRYVLLRPAPRAVELERQVLLRLEGGAPLLVERRQGAGRVLLLTTTVDRDWSNLAIQPAFLPLMQQAARYLARTALRDPDAPSLCGQPREIPLLASDQRLEVTTPQGAIRHFEADRLSGRKTLAFTDTDEPGVYRVAAGSLRALRERPQASFAVNVDTAESDLTPAAAERIAALTAPRGARPERPRRHRVELWHGLGFALLGLLLVEGLLAMRRR